jgi:hypothetical protein
MYNRGEIKLANLFKQLEKKVEEAPMEYFEDPYENEIFYEEPVEKTAGNILPLHKDVEMFLNEDD